MRPHEQSIFNPADGAGCGAGFGSLVIPVMALAVTVPPPAAILEPVLLLMDLLRMAAFRKSLGMKLVKFLVSFGRDGTPMGALLFRRLDTVRVTRTVAGMAGRLTMLFLAQRQVFPPGPGSPRSQTWLGAIPTATSGFTSFVAYASGPPLSGQVIPLRLSPRNLPPAWLFYFFVVNLSKWIPYGLLGRLDLRIWQPRWALLLQAPVGVWVGVRMAKRISQLMFYRLLGVGMALTGCKLLWDGFR